MRYKVYHVFNFDETDMKKRGEWILIVIDMQNLLIKLWSISANFGPIPRKRITFKIIRILTNLFYSRTLEKKYLDDLKNSTLVIKEYELLPHSSSK